jgi:hypothetical protein
MSCIVNVSWVLLSIVQFYELFICIAQRHVSEKLQLSLNQFEIFTLPFQQLFMSALVDNLSLVHYENHIGALDG